MQKKRKFFIGIIAVFLMFISAAAVCGVLIQNAHYGFSAPVSDDERQLRLQMVDAAAEWLGTQGGSSAHSRILQIYNTHEPLAQGYKVQPSDAWCATFVSTVAIQCDQTDIIPTECGCQRQIGLWQAIGRWEEADDHVPLPGDIIYYCIGHPDRFGDCTGHSDHVGIVVGTRGRMIKVIEGNCNNRVAYRYIPVNSFQIRGFGLPDYSK